MVPIPLAPRPHPSSLLLALVEAAELTLISFVSFSHRTDTYCDQYQYVCCDIYFSTAILYVLRAYVTLVNSIAPIVTSSVINIRELAVTQATC